MSYTAQSGDTADPGPLRSHRGWFIALGVILIVAGMIAFLNLLIATVVSIYYVGFLMILGGAAQAVHAFRVKGWGRSALLIVGAIIYALAGIFAFANPLLASSALTLLLAVTLLVAGVLRIIVALRERPRKAWGWVLTAGIFSVITGLIILAGWPVNSLWILGLFLAIDLIFQGWAWLAFGLALGRA